METWIEFGIGLLVKKAAKYLLLFSWNGSLSWLTWMPETKPFEKWFVLELFYLQWEQVAWPRQMSAIVVVPSLARWNPIQIPNSAVVALISFE